MKSSRIGDGKVGDDDFLLRLRDFICLSAATCVSLYFSSMRCNFGDGVGNGWCDMVMWQ